MAAVDRLARTTGANPVPEGKIRRGYRFERDKFGLAGLTPVASETLGAPRVPESPVQLECFVEARHEIAADDDKLRGRSHVFEARIQRVHLEESILMDGDPNRLDPNKRRPLIMSFQKFYGLESSQLHDSSLARIPESRYRSPDVDRARDTSVTA